MRVRLEEVVGLEGLMFLGKCVQGWCAARSSKPLDRVDNTRSVGSIPMHFRQFF